MIELNKIYKNNYYSYIFIYKIKDSYLGAEIDLLKEFHIDIWDEYYMPLFKKINAPIQKELLQDIRRESIDFIYKHLEYL